MRIKNFSNAARRNWMLWFMGLLLIAPAASGQDRPFECFWVSDLEKVFDDAYRLPSAMDTVRLFGIRDEILSAQIVLHARTGLKNISVAPGDLAGGAKGSVIPAATVRWNFVKSVPLTVNSDIARGNSLVRQAPASFPDYLSEERTLSVAAGKFQSIWLTLHIPAAASPGAYNGYVVVQSNKGKIFLPLTLTVYPLVMPKAPHLTTTNWYSLSNQYHKYAKEFDENYFALLETYARNMAEHRQNVLRVELRAVSAEVDATGQYAFDFTNFDRSVEISQRVGPMKLIETGFVGGWAGGNWDSTRMVYREFDVLDRSTGQQRKMKGEEYLPHFLPAFEKHLKEKGWLDKIIFHIADEPCNHNVMSWRSMSEFVHSFAPSLRRIDAIEGSYFDDLLEIWVPKLDQLNNWWDTFRKVQQSGCELWYYLAMTTNAYPNRFIDSPLIEARILHWLNYRFGITGYLHYGFNSWEGADPYTTMREPQYGIGANFLVYPTELGILNSIRWEQERNGLSDYEYLWLLEQSIAGLKEKIGSAGHWIKPEQRGRELATRVISTMTQFTRDPKVLYDTKLEILQEILAMQSHPALYVQTNPPANAKVTYGQILAEITGWTEPGSAVSMNGQNIVVGNDGVFRCVAALTPEITRITVTTRKGAASNSATRSYVVEYP
jgi:hypothetical protein